MTDTTLAPTDADIEELLISCGMYWAERSFWQLEDADLHPAIRAILAKWGVPAPASHEALTTALAACRDAFPVPASGSAAEFEWQGAMTDPLGVPAYVRACAVPPAQEVRVPLSDEGVGKRAKVGPIHTEPGGKVSMFSAQYRQQLEQRYVRGFRDAEKHHGITAAQQKEAP